MIKRKKGKSKKLQSKPCFLNYVHKMSVDSSIRGQSGTLNIIPWLQMEGRITFSYFQGSYEECLMLKCTNLIHSRLFIGIPVEGCLLCINDIFVNRGQTLRVNA